MRLKKRSLRPSRNIERATSIRISTTTKTITLMPNDRMKLLPSQPLQPQEVEEGVH
jgi:hypothetical protein